MYIEEKKYKACVSPLVTVSFICGIALFIGLGYVCSGSVGDMPLYLIIPFYAIVLFGILYLLYRIYYNQQKKEDFIAVDIKGLEVNVHKGNIPKAFQQKYGWHDYAIKVEETKVGSSLIISNQKGDVLLDYPLAAAFDSYAGNLMNDILTFSAPCAVSEDVEAKKGNEGDGYEGKVKCVTTFYTLNEGLTKGPKEKELHYNEAGLLTEAFYFKPDGYKCCTETCNFDADGHLTSKQVKLSDREAFTDTTRSYDADGHLIAEKVENDNMNFSETFTYSNGKLTRSVLDVEDSTTISTYNDKELEVTSEVLHKPGAKEQLVTDVPYNGEDSDFDFRREFEYNEKGLMTKNTAFTMSGVETEREEYEYDDHGQSTVIRYYNGDTLVGESNFRYTYDADNHIVEKVISVYEEGDLTEETKCTYVRDAHNNFTESRFFTNEVLQHVEYYAFEYYD